MFWVTTAFSLPSRSSFAQPQVGRVGLCPLHDELIAVKTVKLLRVLLPEGMAQDGFRRVGVLLMIKSVHAAEVRDAALGGNARPAKDTMLLLLAMISSNACTITKNAPFAGCTFVLR